MNSVWSYLPAAQKVHVGGTFIFPNGVSTEQNTSHHHSQAQATFIQTIIDEARPAQNSYGSGHTLSHQC